jgi:phosphatidylethanolamine-binding protein (PEBP) family uncharacterized protein
MAQRTGDLGLLGPIRKVASAGAIPALAAALWLSGCGGDSDDPTQSTERPPAVAAKEQAQEKASAPSDSATQEQQQPQGKSPSKADQPTNSPQAKQTPPIAAPEGERERGATPAERAQATVASMTLESPAVLTPQSGSTSILPATFTCDGKDTSPPLRWAGVPQGTAELVLFAINLAPVSEELFFDWAVAGINPNLQSLSEGELPRGAILGRNGFGKQGYSVCPKATEETIIFALHAIPSPSGARPGFDPLALRDAVLGQAGDVGLMAVTYARG